jgi:hypothetical protein
LNYTEVKDILGCVFFQGRVVRCGRSGILRYLIPTYPPKFRLPTGVFEPLRAVFEPVPPLILKILDVHILYRKSLIKVYTGFLYKY